MSEQIVMPDHSATPYADLWSLAGRGAVVTGGGRGIGAATVRRLAEAGATVVAADLDASAARQVAESTPGTVVAATVDVTVSSSLDDVAARCVAEAGHLDIWVNNAGIFPTTGPAVEVTDDFIDRMLSVNVRGTFAGARAAAGQMARGGVIVNVASTAGFRGASGISAYVASKHAVVGLTKNLAIELGPLGIRVVGVAPGVIDTPGVQEQLAPLREAGLDVGARMNRSLLGRGGQPDDVARVITMLASDVAAWVTGSVLPVDAGALAG